MKDFEDMISKDLRYSTTRRLFANKESEATIEKLGDALYTLPPQPNRLGEGGLRCQGFYKQNSPSSPLLSIITVTYNAVDCFDKTIHSILCQPYSNIELIIIDGGSTDGTVDCIKYFDKQIDYWVSESDNGIYHAMNKATQLASGQGLLFMNAGDYFEGSVLDESLQIPCFIPTKFVSRFRNKLVERRINPICKGIPNCHQGVIFENKHMTYDTKYKVAADFDYLVRHGYDHHLPMLKTYGYVYYDMGGFSMQNIMLGRQESLRIIRKYCGVTKMLRFVLLGYSRHYLLPVLYRLVRPILSVFKRRKYIFLCI